MNGLSDRAPRYRVHIVTRLLEGDRRLSIEDSLERFLGTLFDGVQVVSITPKMVSYFTTSPERYETSELIVVTSP
jgi:hypothetical protein